MTILGTTPTGDGLPAKALRGRDAERILAGELLQEFRHLSGTMTEFAERYAGRIVNHVLLTETQTFPTSGIIDRQFHVAAGAIMVANLSTATAATTTTVPASTVGADPAAGAEVSVTVPAGHTWQLQSVDVTLVTSGSVANRRVVLVIDDGTNVLAKITAVADQTATQTIEYVFAGGVENSAYRNSVALEPLPALTLGPGYRIRTLTTALAGTDNYGAPVIGYLDTTTTAAVAAHSMTVHSAGPGSAAPGAGVGMYVVPAGATRVVPLASRQVTLYGTAGDQVSFAVYTAAPRPAAV